MKAAGGEAIILLVEDNISHAKMVIRGLRDHRVANQVYHVTDGEQALNYLNRKDEFEDVQKSPRPNLILLDLRLPKIDGLEVLKEIKRDDKFRKIPVVVLTTSEAEKDIACAYDLYANAYLTKPVDFGEFMTLMSDLGFFWLLWNKAEELS